MDTKELRADLYPILADVCGVPVERIEGSLRLIEDLSLDSLKRIEVLSRLSEKYENALDPDVEAILALGTVDDIVRLAEEHLR